MPDVLYVELELDALKTDFLSLVLELVLYVCTGCNVFSFGLAYGTAWPVLVANDSFQGDNRPSGTGHAPSSLRPPRACELESPPMRVF